MNTTALPPVTRAPALAGVFYPADASTLRQEVQARLRAGAPERATGGLPNKMLIIPHAGHRYSGDLAARAYASLGTAASKIRRVVILAPTHRVAIDGLAWPGAQAMATPLGEVALDAAAIAALRDCPEVSARADAHAQEHAVEVHLPFIQVLMPQAQVVPLVVGRASAEQVARVLELLWGGSETLIVISSDLSHFHPYEAAKALDQDTLQRILRGQALDSHQQACGATPINGALLVAQRRGLQAEPLGYMNSGDTPQGDRQRVVGYGAVAFRASARVDRELAGRSLLAWARHAIDQQLGLRSDPPPAAEWLQHPAATFVTLSLRGQLRGCIGSLQAQRSLLDDVRHNAVAAATRDPRFAPLSPEEWAQTALEVSLLSAPQALRFRDEADALRQIQPGQHGVILSRGQQRATFLPQVWKQLPDRAQFWARLKAKGGWANDFWAADMAVATYTVTEWHQAPLSSQRP